MLFNVTRISRNPAVTTKNAKTAKKEPAIPFFWRPFATAGENGRRLMVATQAHRPGAGEATLEPFGKGERNSTAAEGPQGLNEQARVNPLQPQRSRRIRCSARLDRVVISASG